MKLILAICLALFSVTAVAMEQGTGVTEFDVLITVFGESGKAAVGWICAIGYAWALLRQYSERR